MNHPSPNRITRRFAQLKEEGRAGFIAFVTAGDPDYETSLRIVRNLPKHGADVIELGMPFSDPMADGPAIQASSQRALRAGMTLAKTLKLARAFREDDTETPLVLMGYANPLHHWGYDAFVQDAAAAGVDGLIIVDLPPEEDAALRLPATAAGLCTIRLATPTTDSARLPAVLDEASGFLYYVSVTGVTGGAAASSDDLSREVGRLKAATDLPIAVGFGISTPAQAASVARIADAAVVGSALVRAGAEAVSNGESASDAVGEIAARLARSIRAARHYDGPQDEAPHTPPGQERNA